MSEQAGQANSQPAAAPQAQPGQAAAPSSGEMPSLEDVINNMNAGEEGGVPPKEPNGEIDPTPAPQEEDKRPGVDEFERIQRQENELYKMKKQFSDEKKDFERQKGEWDQQKSEFDNYMDTYGDDPEKEKKEDYEELSYDELRDKMRKDIFAELDQQKGEEAEQKETDQAINTFKEKISTLLTDKAGDFPLASGEGLGGADMIYQTIDAQFDQDTKDYGFERANEMMLSPEQAAQKVEKYIAQQMQTMLKSDGVRAFLQKELGFQQAEGRQLNDSNQLRDTPKTLTNSQFNQQSSQGQKSIDVMNDEEAMEYALSFVTPGEN